MADSGFALNGVGFALSPRYGVPELQPLTWTIAVGVLTAFFLGFVMGSNDVANSFGTSVGAGVVTMSQALVIASVFDVAGSLSLGVGVASTIASKIVDVDTFAGQPQLYMVGMLAASVGATICVGVATRLGLPISTTHAVVGAVVGFSFVEYPDGKGVIWVGKGKNGMLSVILSWFVSPLLAGVCAAVVYIITKKYCLQVEPLELAFERHLKLASIMTGVIGFLAAMLVLYKVTDTSTHYKYTNIGISIGILLVLAALSYFVLIPKIVAEQLKRRDNLKVAQIEQQSLVKNDHDGDSGESAPRSTPNPAHTGEPQLTEQLTDPEQTIDPQKITSPDDKRAAADTYPAELELRFSSLNVFSACYMAFAHGANDISNAAGPFIAVWDTFQKGKIDDEVDAQYWIVCLCCVGVVTGLAMWGAYVITTIGSKLTHVTASRAYSMEIGAGTSVLVASFLELPVSSTHCLIGAVVAVGLCNGEGRNAVQWSMVRNILVSWVVTVPLAGCSSAVMYAILKPLIYPGVTPPSIGGVYYPNATMVWCLEGTCRPE